MLFYAVLLEPCRIHHREYRRWSFRKVSTVLFTQIHSILNNSPGMQTLSSPLSTHSTPLRVVMQRPSSRALIVRYQTCEPMLIRSAASITSMEGSERRSRLPQEDMQRTYIRVEMYALFRLHSLDWCLC